ncbi:hypothetical protein BH11MYX4_BH11MYX4_48790 [soil metagenome]
MLRGMKVFLPLALLAVVGCAAIQNADREVNKKTDHGTSHGNVPGDGGASPTTGADAGQDSGVTSM